MISIRRPNRCLSSEASRQAPKQITRQYEKVLQHFSDERYCFSFFCTSFPLPCTIYLAPNDLLTAAQFFSKLLSNSPLLSNSWSVHSTRFKFASTLRHHQIFTPSLAHFHDQERNSKKRNRTHGFSFHFLDITNQRNIQEYLEMGEWDRCKVYRPAIIQLDSSIVWCTHMDRGYHWHCSCGIFRKRVFSDWPKTSTEIQTDKPITWIVLDTI